MNKYASFDLEIAEELTDETTGKPLGITAAAVLCDGWDKPLYWYGQPKLDKPGAQMLVRGLTDYLAQGYRPLTWNGTSFDFRVLAQESDMYDQCANLALEAVDMMLLVTFQKGFRLGLDAALLGAGLESKIHSVTLSDGTIIDDMGGAKAPALWKAGETQAVLTYLDGDVRQPLALAHHIEQTKAIHWLSKKGRSLFVNVPQMYTVRECFSLPEPDTSWMDNPPSRLSFIEWMPDRFVAEMQQAGEGLA